MTTNRLYLRERTRELLEKLMGQSREEQSSFFSYEDIKMLNFELARIEKSLKNERFDFQKWDLIENNSGDVIGNAGFHNWEITHERAELGYVLHEKFRGQGFMVEALKRIVDFGFQEMRLNRIEAFISPDNSSSIKLITKMNFQLEGKLREHYKSNDKIHDSLVFGLLKSEYEKK